MTTVTPPTYVQTTNEFATTPQMTASHTVYVGDTITWSGAPGSGCAIWSTVITGGNIIFQHQQITTYATDGSWVATNIGTTYVILFNYNYGFPYVVYTWILDTGVHPPPTANFTAEPTTGVQPLTVQFTDTSTGVPTSWYWDFGGGATSTEQNPSVLYEGAGTYSVSLRATNDFGSDTEVKTNYITVTLPPPPVAAFSGSPRSVQAPGYVQFTDQSTGSPTSWLWYFGWDIWGNVTPYSTQQHPTAKYVQIGTFSVSLTATNAGGSNTLTKTNYITASLQPPGVGAPVAEFSATPTYGTKPLAVSFYESSSNSPTMWNWSFGDGSTSTSQNPSHTYTTAGVYTVTLSAANMYGSSTKTKTNYITVTNVPGTVDDVDPVQKVGDKIYVSPTYGKPVGIKIL